VLKYSVKGLSVKILGVLKFLMWSNTPCARVLGVLQCSAAQFFGALNYTVWKDSACLGFIRSNARCALVLSVLKYTGKGLSVKILGVLKFLMSSHTRCARVLGVLQYCAAQVLGALNYSVWKKLARLGFICSNARCAQVLSVKVLGVFKCCMCSSTRCAQTNGVKVLGVFRLMMCSITQCA